MKFQVKFVGALLPYEQSLFVIAPSKDAARALIMREARGCDVVSIEETRDNSQVFAEVDSEGNRL